MTQQERARVAFKVLGIGLLVSAAQCLPFVWTTLQVLFSGNMRASSELVAGAGWLAASAVAGVCCLRWAPRLAETLLPPVEPELPWAMEFARGGVCLMGAWFLVAGVGQAFGLATTWGLGVLPAVAVFLLLGVALLAAPGRIAGALGRWARGGLSSAAAGAVLLLLYLACMALENIAATIGFWWSYVGRYPELANQGHQQVLETAAGTGIILVTALVLARFTGGLCRAFARPGESLRASGAGLSFSSSTLIGAALAIGLCCLLIFCVVTRGGMLNYGLVKWGSPWTVLRWGLICGVVLVGVLWGAGFVVWPIGRRLSGSTTAPEAAEAASSGLAVEVALMVLAINGLEQAIARALWATVRSTPEQRDFGTVPAWLPGMALAIEYAALLAFKGDLAWLCRPRRMPEQEPLQAVRAAVLQPWLFLLGLWLAIYGGAALAAWAATCLRGGAWDATWMSRGWETALGVALIVGARWLSVRLSHGRLIRAVGSWVDYGKR